MIKSDDIPSARHKAGVSKAALKFINNARRCWVQHSFENNVKEYSSLCGFLNDESIDLSSQIRYAWKACELIEPKILSNRFFFTDHLIRPEDLSDAYDELCKRYGRIITFDDELEEFSPQVSDHWNVEHAVYYLLSISGVIENDIDVLEGIVNYFRPNMQKAADDYLKRAKSKLKIWKWIQSEIHLGQYFSASELSNISGNSEDDIEFVLRIAMIQRLVRFSRKEEKGFYRLEEYRDIDTTI